jgi:hypothetical protein
LVENKKIPMGCTQPHYGEGVKKNKERLALALPEQTRLKPTRKRE